MVQIVKPDTPVGISSAVRVWFWVFPSDGVWSKEKHYELLLKCQEDDILKGAEQGTACEGGFEWKTTNGLQEIRTYDWHSDIKGDWTLWPTLEDFTKPIHPTDVGGTFKLNRGKFSHAYLPAIRCGAKFNPPFAKVVRLLLLMEASGHSILGTEGFVVTEGRAYLKKGTFKRTDRKMISDLVAIYNTANSPEYIYRSIAQ